jgi:hypothetical protein
MKPVMLKPGEDPTQIEHDMPRGGCGRWLWMIAAIVGLVVGFGLGAAASYHAAPLPTRTPTLTPTLGPSPTPTLTPTLGPSPTPTMTPTPGPITATPGFYPTHEPPVQTCYYTVRAGDMLAAVAANAGTTLAALAKVNKIVNANLIRIGQRLIVPCPELP